MTYFLNHLPKRFLGCLLSFTFSVSAFALEPLLTPQNPPISAISHQILVPHLDQLPVINQARLPICFAAAASLVTLAAELKHGVKKPVIPSAIALAAGVSPHSLQRGGDGCAAVEYAAAAKPAVCSIDAVESKNEDPTGQINQGLNDRISLGAELEKSYTSLDQNQTRSDSRLNTACKTTNPPVIQEAIAKPLMDSLLNNACDLGPTLKEITRDCAPIPPAKQLPNPLKGIDLSCNHFPDPREGKPNATPAEYDQKLQHLLAADFPLPIMVGICSKFMMGGESSSKDPCLPHAVLIVGYNPEKKQYLVRNSWGPECDHYPPEMQKDCIEGTGNIWIDASKLTKNMLEIMTTPNA